MQKKITIQEIAHDAGVSVATVSRVLRNLPGVSDELSARVRKVMTGRESFRPRIKQTRKLTRVTLVAYKSEATMDYFTAMALSGMAKFAFDYAIDVSLLIRPPELFDVPGLVSTLKEHGSDAAIISYSPNDYKFLRDLKAYQSQIPVPLVMCYAACDFLPSIVADVKLGEKQLARHLIELGHRNIGYLGATYEEVYSEGAAMRHDSFQDFCVEMGIPILAQWVHIPVGKHHSLAFYYDSAWELLTRCPELTAIYCFNDDVALAALRVCADMGLRVPEDISITGFDGVTYCGYSTPRLTTYRVKADEMAYEASRVCYVMSKGIKQVSRISVVKGEFIQGESTAPPRKLKIAVGATARVASS